MHRHIEATLIRDDVRTTVTLRFTDRPKSQAITLFEIAARLTAAGWTIQDGDIIEFKEVR